MKIIIDIKETATLSRLAEYSEKLQKMKRNGDGDIIERISKEW